VEHQLKPVEGLHESARLLAAFSGASTIGFVALDENLRFRSVNAAVADMHGIPLEAFIGNTLHDMLGESAPEPEARLRRVFVLGETPAIEISLMLPSRTERGYWIEKSFPIKSKSGKVVQIACIAIEVTAQRKLEDGFRKFTGELLWTNQEYRRLAGYLHQSIHAYHSALAMSLDRLSRCTRDPESIPQMWAQSAETVDQHMRKLVSAITKCFPTDLQH
jgi:hypothetical protein